MENDQCKHCTLRGNFSKCVEEECSQHNNWYALEQQKNVDELKKFIIDCRDEILYPLAHEPSDMGKIADGFGSRTVELI